MKSRLSEEDRLAVADLHRHLQWALELEHSTLPPYLCALYSIHEGSNRAAAEAIRDVAMQEMLHMVLVANLLNAVGGSPALDHPAFIPRYPTRLPHSAARVMIHLLPFSPRAIETFMRIERPEPVDAPPEYDGYHTIGQFYDGIRDRLVELSGRLGEQALFNGPARRQIDPRVFYYGAAGRCILVDGLASALEAIDEIKAQGEGLPGSVFEDTAPFGERELAHYFRFQQILLGRAYQRHDSPASGPTGPRLPVDWHAVHPMGADPKTADHAHRHDVRAMMSAFNRSYSAMLRGLHVAFNGEPAMLVEVVPMMYRLKYQAVALMQVPCSPDAPAGGPTVGPSFEYER